MHVRAYLPRLVADTSALCDTSTGRPSRVSPVLSRSDYEGEIRHNEYLAVLMHKELWKPSSQASRCDIFLCSHKFSILEGRHHCRKCGGVFCTDCSTHFTTLLDTSNLPFLNPPHKSVSIYTYASPESPVYFVRVCDQCWDQIHGTKSPRSRSLQKKRIDAERREVNVNVNLNSPLDLGASFPETRDRYPSTLSSYRPLTRKPPRQTHTDPCVNSSSSKGSSTATSGGLELYPLRHASAICKANGGGRWQPKPRVEVVGVRIPGVMAAYEREIKHMEEEETTKHRPNPIVKHGDFQLRITKVVEPRGNVDGPFADATF
ncbi:FYVE zinc finger-domain-containing protein [Irpex lacteus]|nr:FYVE zinc finger-domain-containing protein [Irpex lacteus]